MPNFCRLRKLYHHFAMSCPCTSGIMWGEFIEMGQTIGLLFTMKRTTYYFIIFYLRLLFSGGCTLANQHDNRKNPPSLQITCYQDVLTVSQARDPPVRGGTSSVIRHTYKGISCLLLVLFNKFQCLEVLCVFNRILIHTPTVVRLCEGLVMFGCCHSYPFQPSLYAPCA
jgi:hypothetical protein